jgi:putative drug exporter of the RND superfamily
VRAITDFVTGRRKAWITVVVCLVALGLTFALIPRPANTSPSTAGLPASAESQRVADLLTTFPTANTAQAIVVWNRLDGHRLTPADRSAINNRVSGLASLSTRPRDIRTDLSPDRIAMAATVLVKQTAVEKDAGAVASGLRAAARAGLPSDIEARLTGEVATAAENQAAVAGTDFWLTLIFGVVAALLLMLFTRSFVVWIVPVIVIGAAEWLTTIVAGEVDAALDLPVSTTVGASLSVVVAAFGAGLSLLLIVCYREESRGTDDRHVAMRDALEARGRVIAASAAISALGLLALLAASPTNTRALGLACAIGIAVDAIFVLVLLPAAMVVFPRGAFWLPTPRFADPKATAQDPQPRFAEAVEVRRTPFAIIAVVIVGVLALGLIGAQVGGQQTYGNPESVLAQKLADHSFGPGYGNRAIMLVPNSLAGSSSVTSPTTLAIDQDAVHSVTRGESHAGRTELLVALTADAGSAKAITTVRALRASIARAGGSTARTLIGGPDAVAIDTLDASATDREVVIPILAAALLIMLILLTRALLAPVILLAASVAAFVAGLGVANLISTRFLGYSTLDASVIVPAFCLVVAIGVSNSVVLILRARDGMRDAVSTTGGPLVGAAFILAGGFVVLSLTTPVVAVIQLGWIVAAGTLLDALLLRALLVPSLAFILGEHLYWPRRKELAK